MPTNTFGQPLSQGSGSPVPSVYSTVPGANPNTAMQTPGTMSGTLNATFPQPASKTVSPPIVATSDAANDHIAQMNTSASQAQADLAAHTVAQNTPPTPTDNSNGSSAPANGSSTQTPDYDSQINDILSSLSDGSTTAQASPLEQGVLDSDNAQNAQDQQTQADVGNAIRSMDNGTYPLSTNEKAQVSAVAGSYADALKAAQNYAAAIGAGATTAGAISGLQENSPQFNVANIQNAVTVGQQKIADINAKILDAQGKLTTALQNGDYKSATDLYKQIGDNITARTKEITDIQKTITDETTQMRDNAKTQLSTLIDEKKMDATAAQNAVDNAYKNGMLTIAEKKLKDAEIGKSTYSGATSPVTSPLGIDYNPPASIAPYVGFATNGVKYVDMADFAGTPTEKNAAVADAQAAGYKVITNKNTALDMQNISNATANLQSMQDAFDENAPDSAAARDTYAAEYNKLTSFLQTNPDLAAINTFQDTALDILKAISGVQGFRGGAAAIENVKETLPTPTDTKATADKKIANIQTLINNRETALVGKPSLVDQQHIDDANAKTNINTYVQNNPINADMVANLYSVPGATDASVYEYLKQAGKITDSGSSPFAVPPKTLSNADMRTLYANASTKSYNQGNGSFVIDGTTYAKNPDGTFTSQ